MLPDCKLFCIRLSLAWSRSWKMVRCALQVELLSPSRRLGLAIHRQFSTYLQHTQKKRLLSESATNLGRNKNTNV